MRGIPHVGRDDAEVPERPLGIGRAKVERAIDTASRLCPACLPFVDDAEIEPGCLEVGGEFDGPKVFRACFVEQAGIFRGVPAVVCE
jgi:hypothetical protein